MAYKQKGFPMHAGVSPMKNEDGKEWKMPSLIQTKNEEQQYLKKATDGMAVKKDASGRVETKSTAGAKLGSSKYEQGGDLNQGDKKWHETDAFKDTGIGHITDAVKSISRGIKNIRTKNKAKKAERLTSAKEAVGSGTETLKQAKTVERNRKRTANQAERKAKSDAKDKKKLAEYRKKNPVRGREAIKVFANQTKNS